MGPGSEHDGEQPLAGNRLTAGVVRVGPTVRRPASPASPFVSRLLTHLAKRGFDGCPNTWGGTNTVVTCCRSYLAMSLHDGSSSPTTKSDRQRRCCDTSMTPRETWHPSSSVRWSAITTPVRTTRSSATAGPSRHARLAGPDHRLGPPHRRDHHTHRTHLPISTASTRCPEAVQQSTLPGPVAAGHRPAPRHVA